MSTSLKRFILSIFLFLVFGCTTTQPLKEAAIQNSSNANTSIISSSKTNVRSPAADNYFAPRDIKESPYRDIQLINYEQLKSSLIQYISSRPAWVPFQNQEQRWEWASRHAQSAPQFFKILPYQSDTSDAALMQKIKENHPEITRKFGWVTRTSWFKNRKASRLFAYEIFYKNTHNKPSILIWAKEHGDELSTSEFTTELAKFFLLHLQGKGNSELNEVIQNLFSKINVIIVPDMTPDKSFETFKNKTSTREDFNGFHQLLQPDRKTDLYRIFGYTIIDTKAINSCPSANHIISNPDLETVNVGINLDYQGVGYTGIPLVLNKEKENVSAEATLQSNFDFQFCMIDPTNKRKSLMVQASDTNYEKQIGDNTAQTFHPDELLAESFALLLTRNINSLPNPEFIRNLHMTLK